MIHWKNLKHGRILLMAVAAVAMAGAIACSSDDDDSSPSSAAGDGLEVSVGQSDLGSYLVGPNGRTLYVFLQDVPDTSNCKDTCLQTWPPLLLGDATEVKAAAAASGTFASIDTPSGKQVTYNKAPLYYFTPDTQAGDTKGHLVGDVWFLARPDTASTRLIGVSGSGDGAFLVGPTGMTLYTFDNDTGGVSNCAAQCLQSWPALKVPANLQPTAVTAATGTLAALTRDDGGKQATYNGQPLYYFAADKVPGDTTGDGVGGVWHLAKPGGSASGSTSGGGSGVY